MTKLYEYRVWIGGWHHDTKATDAREAKRNAAWVYRKVRITDQSIAELIKVATAKRY